MQRRICIRSAAISAEMGTHRYFHYIESLEADQRSSSSCTLKRHSVLHGLQLMRVDELLSPAIRVTDRFTRRRLRMG